MSDQTICDNPKCKSEGVQSTLRLKVPLSTWKPYYLVADLCPDCMQEYANAIIRQVLQESREQAVNYIMPNTFRKDVEGETVT